MSNRTATHADAGHEDEPIIAMDIESIVRDLGQHVLAWR
jgi:hypothetical protein